MNVYEAFRIALRGLRANRLRSVLTTLGIVIGVAAVIVLVALGNGIQAGFTDQFASLTTQIAVVPTEGDRTARDITDGDVEALENRNQAPDIASGGPDGDRRRAGPAARRPPLPDRDHRHHRRATPT